MRNCSYCNKKNVCKLYENFNKEMTLGLQSQALTAHETNSTTFSHQAIISSVARSCNLYETFDVENYLGDKIEVLHEIVEDLKLDTYFSKEFLNSKSPEHRAKLISENIDEDDLVKKLKSLSDVDDHIEDIMNYILSKFGL